jgi:hypothetical protein
VKVTLPAFRPLLPTDEHLLRYGRRPEPGESTVTVKELLPDGSRDTRRGEYQNQSTPALVMSLLSHCKTQDVLTMGEVFDLVMDEHNVGTRWLRDQDDPRATFDDMWERAYQHVPKFSVEQVVTLVLQLITDEPGIRLSTIRAVIGAHFHRGALDSLLDGLIDTGVLRDERQYGPSGRRCTVRRFWLLATDVAAVVKRVVTTVSIGLLGVGLRTSAGEGPSYRRLLTSKKIWAAGVRRYRHMAALTRQQKRRQEVQAHRREAEAARAWRERMAMIELGEFVAELLAVDVTTTMIGTELIYEPTAA